MKKYMVVCKIGSDQSAEFFDTLGEANQYKMDAECGMGGEAEVYEYKRDEDGFENGYEFLYA